MPPADHIKQMSPQESQLTHEPFGHCLNSTQCVSPNGRYIVYDTRNDDSALASNGQIRVLDTETGEDFLIYETENQTEYGPGVGAATWSPDGSKILFLGGIQNADKNNPYSFTRRTGIAIEWTNPLIPIFMDARDMNVPSTPGALRGGTHAHTWSGLDGWISFTYNDHLIAEAAKTDPSLADLRTVGVMFPGEVIVDGADGVENKNGTMYSVIVVPVVKDPTPGTDEVNKAFDECWIGQDGYVKEDGTRQRKAIAYQGNIVDENGNIKTEIFIADLPDDLPGWVKNNPATGSATEMPAAPGVILRRRISFLKDGVSAVPRHWLRTTPDGSLVGFYAKDDNGIIQLWGISPNGGEARQLSHLPLSASGPFNFSFDGKHAALIAGDRVWLVDVVSGNTVSLTGQNPDAPPSGAVVWSSRGELFFNRMVNSPKGVYRQVCRIAFRDRAS